MDKFKRKTVQESQPLQQNRTVRWRKGKQTFAVGSVEERHVNDGWLLLLPLKHVTIFGPVFLLHDLVIYLWKRLPFVQCILLCKSQGLESRNKKTVR